MAKTSRELSDSAHYKLYPQEGGFVRSNPTTAQVLAILAVAEALRELQHIQLYGSAPTNNVQ